ncbi:thiol:disulfide interchange protein DsbG [Afifella pfennigii]|uniref:thiol:disulfide interchange protein DsbG n=1 Tax=Afifella pfennigii TaxID=209897 RepID=UPI00068FC9AA|nr:thiol:disulfide interchange protein DsbG [Afifella pfennigii]
MIRYLAAAAAILLLAGCSDDTSGQVTSAENKPGENKAGENKAGAGAALLATLESRGLKIHGPLEAPGGLSAFAASSGARPLAVYILPDPDYAVIGTLIDAQGNPVLEEELRQMVSLPVDEGAWGSLEAARWVPDGDPEAARIVYTFTDPNCPFCNEFWRAARPWVEAGKVQLRHVMVGIIRPDSAAKAAAILEAEAPEEALTFNERNQGEGGISPLPSVSRQTSADLAENLELMRELGFSGTPGIVARGGDGSLVLQTGAPRGSALETLLGPR